MGEKRRNRGLAGIAAVLMLAGPCTAGARNGDGQPPLPDGKAAAAAVKGKQKTGGQNEFRYAVRTNAVWLGMGVLNLGLEAAVGPRLSVEFPVSYSPYCFRRSYRLQVLALQPEVRFWPDRPFHGHFFGLHIHTGKFNIALNDRRRYQDNRWLVGCGLSYGYYLPFARRWGAEFTAGAGYAHLNYDIFYNVPDGARFDTRSRNYWGLTRAGVTLSYRFNIR